MDLNKIHFWFAFIMTVSKLIFYIIDTVSLPTLYNQIDQRQIEEQCFR